MSKHNKHHEKPVDQTPPVLSPEYMRLLHKAVPVTVAESLVGVQPMDPQFFQHTARHGMNEAQLRLEGYEPVSSLGLMWVKK